MRWSSSVVDRRALDAAASQMPSKPSTRVAVSGGRPGTARNMPTSAVNTISATTRGLVRSSIGGTVGAHAAAQCSGARRRASSETSTNSSSAAPALCSDRDAQRQAELDVGDAQRDLRQHQHRQQRRPSCACPACAAGATPSREQVARTRPPPSCRCASWIAMRACAVEHAAFVVDADAAPEHEAFAEIVRRPPLADALSGNRCRRRARRSWRWSSRRARSARASSDQADDHQRRAAAAPRRGGSAGRSRATPSTPAART